MKKEQRVRKRIFKATVDYGLSLGEMIGAGRYEYVDPRITAEHFPLSGKGKVERKFAVISQSRQATTEELIAELAQYGYRPAKTEDLLAFVAKFPDLRTDFPIVALDSYWDRPDDIRGFVFINWIGNSRYLGLYFGEQGWDGYHRFLAVQDVA